MKYWRLFSLLKNKWEYLLYRTGWLEPDETIPCKRGSVMGKSYTDIAAILSTLKETPVEESYEAPFDYEEEEEDEPDTFEELENREEVLEKKRLLNNLFDKLEE